MESGNTGSLNCMGASSGTGSDQSDVPKAFTCHICLELPTNAVLTFCGHMFCWPCLYRWLQNLERPCPLCKTVLRKGEILPIYGGHEVGSTGSSNSIPPRPNPLRSAANPWAGSTGGLRTSGRILGETSFGDGGAADAAAEPGTDGSTISVDGSTISVDRSVVDFRAPVSADDMDRRDLAIIAELARGLFDRSDGDYQETVRPRRQFANYTQF